MPTLTEQGSQKIDNAVTVDMQIHYTEKKLKGLELNA